MADANGGKPSFVLNPGDISEFTDASALPGGLLKAQWPLDNRDHYADWVTSGDELKQ